jgi:hypothetical protein
MMIYRSTKTTPASFLVRSASDTPAAGSALLLFDFFLDVLDRVPDGEDFLRGLVRDLDAELLFERHHQLNGIEAVRAQMLDEAGVLDHLGFLDTEVFDNDLFDPFGDQIAKMLWNSIGLTRSPARQDALAATQNAVT